MVERIPAEQAEGFSRHPAAQNAAAVLLAILLSLMSLAVLGFQAIVVVQLALLIVAITRSHNR